MNLKNEMQPNPSWSRPGFAWGVRGASSSARSISQDVLRARVAGSAQQIVRRLLSGKIYDISREEIYIFTIHIIHLRVSILMAEIDSYWRYNFHVKLARIEFH
jgi:hypothetical protein